VYSNFEIQERAFHSKWSGVEDLNEIERLAEKIAIVCENASEG